MLDQTRTSPTTEAAPAAPGNIFAASQTQPGPGTGSGRASRAKYFPSEVESRNIFTHLGLIVKHYFINISMYISINFFVFSWLNLGPEVQRERYDVCENFIINHHLILSLRRFDSYSGLVIHKTHLERGKKIS